LKTIRLTIVSARMRETTPLKTISVILIVFNGVLYLIRAETIVILNVFYGVLYLIRAETIVILIVFNGVLYQIDDTIEND
jgi:hypothetical protein